MEAFMGFVVTNEEGIGPRWWHHSFVLDTNGTVHEAEPSTDRKIPKNFVMAYHYNIAEKSPSTHHRASRPPQTHANTLVVTEISRRSSQFIREWKHSRSGGTLK